MSVSIEQVIERIRRLYPDLVEDFNWGERALFYNPMWQFPKGIYVLTFKERDGASDRASGIATGEYRLNVGISKRAFVERFGKIPDRPAAGGVVRFEGAFTQSDVVTPHPVYGWMCWIAVKNPSNATLDELMPLIAESYQIAGEKFKRRMAAAARKAGQTVRPQD